MPESSAVRIDSDAAAESADGAKAARAAPEPTHGKPVLAGLFILISSTGFGLMGAGVRALEGRVPAIQVAFWRNFVGFVILLGVMLIVLRRLPRPRAKGVILVRSVVGCVALVCSFYAIQLAGLGVATVLNHTSTLWVAALAPLLVRERPTWRATAAIVVGFAGVLLVVRPGAGGVSAGIVFGLVSGFGAGIAYLMIRKLASTDEPFTIVTVFSGTSSLLIAPLLLIEPMVPTAGDMVILVGVGTLGTIAQLAMTSAFRHAGAVAVAGSKPITIALAATLGVWWFGEVLHPLTVAGAVLIVASAMFGLAQRAGVGRTG